MSSDFLDIGNIHCSPPQRHRFALGKSCYRDFPAKEIWKVCIAHTKSMLVSLVVTASIALGLKPQTFYSPFLSSMDRQVVSDKHPVLLVMVVLCLHFSWLLGILKVTRTDFRKAQYSYGQLLSMSAPVPAVYSSCKILYKKWRFIRENIWRTPGYLANELWYLVVGGSDRPNRNKVLSFSKHFNQHLNCKFHFLICHKFVLLL